MAGLTMVQTNGPDRAWLRDRRAVFYEGYDDPSNYQRVSVQYKNGRFCIDSEEAGIGWADCSGMKTLRKMVETVANELEAA